VNGFRTETDSPAEVGSAPTNFAERIPGTVYLIPFQQLKEVPGVRGSARRFRPRLLSLERAPEALLRIFEFQGQFT
jgi:hypothetical protein